MGNDVTSQHEVTSRARGELCFSSVSKLNI